MKLSINKIFKFNDVDFFYKLFAYGCVYAHALYMLSDYIQGIQNNNLIALRCIFLITPLVLLSLFKSFKKYFFLFILAILISNQLYMIYLSQLHWVNIAGLVVVHMCFVAFLVNRNQFYIVFFLTILSYILCFLVNYSNHGFQYIPLYIICINLVLLTIFLHNLFHKYQKKIKKIAKEKSSLLIKSEKNNKFLNSTYNQLIHDVKSPLTALKHLSGVEGKQGSLLQAATDRVEKIIYELEQKQRSLNNFNTYFDIIESVNSVIEEAKIRYMSEMQEIKIDFINELKNNLVKLHKMDKHTFCRVFSNLLNNSIEAKNSDNFLIEIKIRSSKENNLALIVKDNGPGMKEHLLKKAVLKGFTTKKTGYGLGLSHAKEIVEKSNGCLELLNENGLTIVLELDYLSAS